MGGMTVQDREFQERLMRDYSCQGCGGGARVHNKRVQVTHSVTCPVYEYLAHRFPHWRPRGVYVGERTVGRPRNDERNIYFSG